ncbi:MAG: OmpA family protein [Phycisphaerales bacterium]|nr:OmpA family protein [Phycisphaerales bacterium]
MADEHKEEHGEGHGGGSHGGGGHGGGGHGGGGEHEEAGAPEWLISFADNVALMMGFFVILLAMNMGPKGKDPSAGEPSDEAGQPSKAMLDFVIGMREGFGNPIDISSSKPQEQQFVQRMRELRGESETTGVPGKKPSQQSLRKSDYSAIGSKVPFDDMSVALNAAAREVIKDTAKKILGQRFFVEVRGHVSPHEAQRDSARAFKLGTDRAMAVIQALIELGVPSSQLRVVSCADNDRIVPNTWSRENDRTNQRVEVIMTSEALPPDPYAKQATGNEPTGD